jgi:hypothetical protein
VIADIRVALQDAAADAKGDVGLELRPDVAGQRQLRLVVGLGEEDRLDALRRFLRRAGGLTGGQKRQRRAAKKGARKLRSRQGSHEDGLLASPHCAGIDTRRPN